MSDTPLLTSADEMLETAQLRLVDIHFDHLSIDVAGNAPQKCSDLENNESTPIEINCTLGTRQEDKRFGTRFEFQFKTARQLSQSSPIMRAAKSLLSPPKPLPTSRRESRSWQRFLMSVRPSAI